jgi:hypothetical protein
MSHAGFDPRQRDAIDRIAEGLRRLGAFEAPNDQGAVLRSQFLNKSGVHEQCIARNPLPLFTDFPPRT